MIPAFSQQLATVIAEIPEQILAFHRLRETLNNRHFVAPAS